MGAGCLVLVNETPENREVLGEAGFLYPFNDSKSLARLMMRVCSRAHEYDQYRERARQRVRDSYSWEAVVTQYEDIFNELTAD